MRFALVAAVSIVVAACSSRGQPPAGVAPRPDSAMAATAVADAERQWLDALVRRDTAAMTAYVGDEFVLSGGVVETRQQYMASALIPDRTLEPIALSDRTVRVYGTAAVSLGAAALKGMYKGREIDFTYRYTNVWVFRDGRWQIVASQVTGYRPTDGG